MTKEQKPTLIWTEIDFDKDGKQVMGFTLPFGVALEAGMGMRIGKDPVKVIQYRTCNSVGCVATVPFDDALSKSLGGTEMECDLVAQVVVNGGLMGYLYDPAAKNFIPADGSDRISDATLRALAATPGQEVTYTAATPGSGSRPHAPGRRQPQQVLQKVSQETLAEMIGTTRSRVNLFMNKFKKLGFIEYNGEIKVNKSLLTVVLHD